MESDIKLDELKYALKGRMCSIEKHFSVMEITFEREDDANWFQDIFEKFQRESAACCLMSIKPKNAPPKFIFNITNIDRFIELIKKLQ